MTTTTSSTKTSVHELQAVVRRAVGNESTISDQPLSEKATTTLANFKDQQSTVLPHKKLMVVFPAIAMAQMIAYLDQTSVSTALPAIGEGLDLGPQVVWVASSFLIASTSIQLINGRLSDIFGRKPMLLTCLMILAIGNLGAGFAQNAGMLFAFRSLSGLGGGAITALVMIVASDVTTLKQRGKYNGFIGAMVGLGNGLGPLIGGAVTEKASWRWCFWYTIPVIGSVCLLLFLVVPTSTVHGKASTKFRMIDWIGLFFSVAAILLILVDFP
nr:putative transporter c3h1.06c [Quercus suber]